MKLKKTILSIGVTGAGIFLLAACQAGANAEVGQPTTTTSAAVVNNDQAVRDLTEARCNREVACNNIGQDKKYTDFNACTRELRHDTGITLRNQACPNGILQGRLSSCLDQINTERCGNPLDTIERLASCRKGMLCK